ncbi:hypothetical protein H0E87_012025, partial [Populus deltoides]
RRITDSSHLLLSLSLKVSSFLAGLYYTTAATNHNGYLFSSTIFSSVLLCFCSYSL